jgi:uncharacterized protein (DUF1697 family)
VQSGKIALVSPASSERVAEKVNGLIKERFGFDVIVLVRSGAELEEVVRRNPFRKSHSVQNVIS